MIRNLTEKEVSKITSVGYKLLLNMGVQIVYKKMPCMRGVYLIYPKGADVNGVDYSYSTYNFSDLNGFFDGYFKGLNKVFGDTRE